MKKQIILFALTACLLLTSCTNTASSIQDLDLSKSEPSKAELSEQDLENMQKDAISFAEFFDTPFSSTDELDYQMIGHNSLYQIAAGENNSNFETDSSGYPYIPKKLLQSYVQEHFGIENYEYPVSDDPNILPQYNPKKDAYLFGAAREGSRSIVSVLDETVIDKTVIYSMKFETPNIETGEIMETRNIEYEFEIISTAEGYVLKAKSAQEIK